MTPLSSDLNLTISDAEYLENSEIDDLLYMPDLLQSRFISDIHWEFSEQLQELFEPLGIYLDTECGMTATTREQVIADLKRLIIAVNATDIE